MKVFKNFNLKNFNSYKIDAVCERAYFPASSADFLTIFKENKRENIILIGNGNNIILSKDFYNESFIILNDCFNSIKIDDTIIEAQSAATFYEISNKALQNSLTGFEQFYDIPSSVGGGVVMNAGSNEGEIKDILIDLTYLDIFQRKIIRIDNKEANFSYRNSFFQDNDNTIVLSARFQLKKGKKENIKNKMIRIKNQRWEKQPRNYPNCGSVFKRPKGYYVGAMMDELQLKGYRIGGAEISKKHSGFIVNIDNASGKDILELINSVKEKVRLKFGVDLEIEQRII